MDAIANEFQSLNDLANELIDLKVMTDGNIHRLLTGLFINILYIKK